MNDILHKVNLNSKSHLYASYRNDRRYTSSKRKLRKNSIEIRPLISGEPDSGSEEEITLHDIRHIRRLHSGQHEHSNLRKINKSDSSERNGNVSGIVNESDPFQHCEFLCLKLEEGDTLQSISIKYQCSISDLKRANNLISNQEFYALKNLKIPVKKYSLLTEILPSVHTSRHDGTVVADNNVRIINVGIGHVGRSSSPEETATFFKRMDEDLVKIMLSTQTQKESLEAAAVALTAPQIQPLVKDPYNTVDCGIQWNYLLICVIIFAIVIPAIVALYMYVRSSHAHHQDVYSSNSPNETFNSVAKLSIKSKS